MIISVSRRTDIPAFFGEWFIRRIKEGYFYSINPFNPKQIKGFSLEPEAVDAFVFWSKNPKPFIQYLDILNDRGYNYYFQFTLNDYPKIFEPYVPDITERIEIFLTLSEKIGAEKVIWRYDPIILSTITPVEYHLEKICQIAEKLSGHTKRLVISFLDFYTKVKTRLKKLKIYSGIDFFNILDKSKEKDLISLVKQLNKISLLYKFNIFTCSEKIDLSSEGIEHGSCIDGNLIKNIFNLKKEFNKDKNQRSECLCAESIDVGFYNTCKHQCIYCYANFSEKTICNNLKKHRIDSPCLINCGAENLKIIENNYNLGKTKKDTESKQLSMFD